PRHRAGQRPEPAQPLARDQRQFIEVLVDRADAEAGGKGGQRLIRRHRDIRIARARRTAAPPGFGERRAAPWLTRLWRREREDAVAAAPGSVSRPIKQDAARTRTQHAG